MMSRVVKKVCQSVSVLLLVTLFCVCFDAVECRRAVEPVEDVEDIIKRLNNVHFININNEGPPCLLDIQRDLPEKNSSQPLYIIPNTNQFWLPNVFGYIQVPRGAAIELHCSKSFANSTVENKDTTTNSAAATSTTKTKAAISNTVSTNTLKVPKNTKTIQPRCLHDKTFLWQGEQYEFEQFACEQPEKYTVEQLNEKCPMMSDGETLMGAQMYRVGFNVTRNRFLETMRICYDDTVVRTLYVQHIMLPANIHFQKFIKRLNFSKAGYFKDLNMNHFYTQKNQQEQAAALLPGKHDHFFNNNTLFLARGHLAAKSDFIYANQQRATFTFFNIAPQWQSFNAGQWAALEDEVRKFVAKSNILVDCYTGTWGTLQLPYQVRAGGTRKNASASSAIQYRDIYLSVDNNNNGILPVPQLFYRVLIDRSHYPKRGIALVGVNNPHVTLDEIKASYVICEDIREQVGWLRWMRNRSLRKGFMYACRVSDFAAAVGHLPKSLLDVTEILV